WRARSATLESHSAPSMEHRLRPAHHPKTCEGWLEKTALPHCRRRHHLDLRRGRGWWNEGVDAHRPLNVATTIGRRTSVFLASDHLILWPEPCGTWRSVSVRLVWVRAAARYGRLRMAHPQSASTYVLRGHRSRCSGQQSGR